MNNFMETYGKAIFVLVIVAILIAFAGPLGMKIKNATTDKVSQTEQIGCNEISAAVGKTDDSEIGGSVRPAEPTEAVDKVYCIYYDDGEMTISQNEIEPESGRTVVNKGFYESPCYCSQQMTTVNFVEAVKPKSCYGWFQYCKKLTQIENIENLCLPSDIRNMFFCCESLTSLSLSPFYTSKVTDMNYLFKGCTSLTTIILGDNFDTSNVAEMKGLFTECESLTSIEFGNNFNTSKVTNMSGLFYWCKSLINLDLTKFDTSNVNDMSSMFQNCDSLTNITFGDNFNTSAVTKMDSMFHYCKALTNITFLTKFDTSNVNNMSYMFFGCYSLTNITFGDNFNTSAVTKMDSMFSWCTSLKTIDISHFNTSNTKSMISMFARSTKITSVNVSQATYDKLKTVSNLGITADKFNIVK